MSAARPPSDEIPSGVRLHRLEGAKPTETGLLFRRGEESFLLPWHRMSYAFAARVGEGPAACFAIRLVLPVRGAECQLIALDTTELREASQHARALALALGPEACDPALRTLVAEGLIVRHFVEAEVFDESVLEAVRWAMTADRPEDGPAERTDSALAG